MASIPCTNCRYCVKGCPQGVVIPEIMGLLNLELMTGNRDFAKGLYSWQAAPGPASKCVSCGACARACKMDVDITKTPNHAECIRCGMCMKACPTDAIQYKFGLGDQSNTETTKE